MVFLLACLLACLPTCLLAFLPSCRDLVFGGFGEGGLLKAWVDWLVQKNAEKPKIGHPINPATLHSGALGRQLLMLPLVSPMVFFCFPYGFPMVSLWFSFGVPMVFLLACLLACLPTFSLAFLPACRDLVFGGGRRGRFIKSLGGLARSKIRRKPKNGYPIKNTDSFTFWSTRSTASYVYT